MWIHPCTLSQGAQVWPPFWSFPEVISDSRFNKKIYIYIFKSIYDLQQLIQNEAPKPIWIQPAWANQSSKHIKSNSVCIEGLLQKGDVRQPSYITSHSRGWASLDSSMLGSCACHKFRTADWMEALIHAIAVHMVAWQGRAVAHANGRVSRLSM